MIGVGERAPDFALPRGGGDRARLYGFVGGAPSVLAFLGRAGAGDEAVVDRLRRALGPSATVHVVARQAPEEREEVFVDADAAVHGAYGVEASDGVSVIVLDRNVRVAATQELDDRSDGIDNVAAVFRELSATRPGQRAGRHAPVLLVPNALSVELCDHLIAVWEAAGPVETGVETMADGRRVDALDRLRKRRRDHIVSDRDLMRTLTKHLGRRVLPEVQKAFAYHANRFEGFKIGSYTDEDAGFFEAHRDNLSPATAHRRFALSLNLNDDYEGGELCFPEYGPDLYRPERGEALIFSGAHLHEVRPVTSGRRFVLLSFLFGNDAARGGRR